MENSNFHRNGPAHQFSNAVATRLEARSIVIEMKNVFSMKRWGARFRLFALFVLGFLASVLQLTSGFIFSPHAARTSVYMEVVFAVLLIALAIAIYVMRKRKPLKPSARVIAIYKVILTLPLPLVILYLALPSYNWNLLIIGLTWRCFVLSLVLEDLFEIYRRRLKKTRNLPVGIH